MSDITWPAEMRMAVHLRSGSSIYGTYAEMTESEYAQAENVLGEVMTGSGGWRLTVNKEGGDTAIIPKDSVDFVALEFKREEPS